MKCKNKISNIAYVENNFYTAQHYSVLHFREVSALRYTWDTMLSAVQDCVTGSYKPPPKAESPVSSCKLACIADHNCYRF